MPGWLGVCVDGCVEPLAWFNLPQARLSVMLWCCCFVVAWVNGLVGMLVGGWMGELVDVWM